MPGGRSRQGRGLLTTGRRALPGKLQAATAHQARVALGAGQHARSIVQQRAGGVRLKHAHGRDGERFDVPHHVAEVVVIVVPGRQAEDRGRGRRRGMDRAVEIEERRIGQGLPTLVGADQADAAFPELGPFGAVALASRSKALGRRLGRQSSGLLVRHGVQRLGYDTGDLSQPERPAGAGGRHGVLADEPVVAQRWAFGFQIACADEFGDQGDAAG
jgi:hypothetical protein